MPVTSKLSPTTQRFWLVLNDHTGLSRRGGERSRTSDTPWGPRRTSAATSVNLPWLIRIRALVTSRLYCVLTANVSVAVARASPESMCAEREGEALRVRHGFRTSERRRSSMPNGTPLQNASDNCISASPITQYIWAMFALGSGRYLMRAVDRILRRTARRMLR